MRNTLPRLNCRIGFSDDTDKKNIHGESVYGFHLSPLFFHAQSRLTRGVVFIEFTLIELMSSNLVYYEFISCARHQINQPTDCQFEKNPGCLHRHYI